MRGRPHVPYVVGAPQGVADRARGLGLPGCIENLVAEAILRDALRGSGPRRTVLLGSDGTRSGRGRPAAFKVTVERARSPLTRRRGWRAVAVEDAARAAESINNGGGRS
jgi:hypothetical protein